MEPPQLSDAPPIEAPAEQARRLASELRLYDKLIRHPCTDWEIRRLVAFRLDPEEMIRHGATADLTEIASAAEQRAHALEALAQRLEGPGLLAAERRSLSRAVAAEERALRPQYPSPRVRLVLAEAVRAGAEDVDFLNATVARLCPHLEDLPDDRGVHPLVLSPEEWAAGVFGGWCPGLDRRLVPDLLTGAISAWGQRGRPPQGGHRPPKWDAMAELLVGSRLARSPLNPASLERDWHRGREALDGIARRFRGGYIVWAVQAFPLPPGFHDGGGGSIEVIPALPARGFGVVGMDGGTRGLRQSSGLSSIRV